MPVLTGLALSAGQETWGPQHQINREGVLHVRPVPTTTSWLRIHCMYRLVRFQFSQRQQLRNAYRNRSTASACPNPPLYTRSGARVRHLAVHRAGEMWCNPKLEEFSVADLESASQPRGRTRLRGPLVARTGYSVGAFGWFKMVTMTVIGESGATSLEEWSVGW